MVEEQEVKNWRLAKSLIVLREQVNDLHPRRSKVSDGSIGDYRHSQLKSDHNPDDEGVVHAIDLTHDPEHLDGTAFAEALRLGRDQRLKYVIWSGRIFSSAVRPWQWRPYPGTNRHEHHVHISVVDGELADDASPWAI